jgi:hypothetical protein
MLAWESGEPETKGCAVFAPDTANATTPYQVSPVLVVVTEIVSEESGEVDIAYHVCTVWPPPMESGDSLGMNVRPAESLTEKAAPDGQQSQPTIITSFDWVVVRERLHAFTYPQPVEAEPSTAILLVVDAEEELVVETAGLIASTMTPKSFPCGVPKESEVGVTVDDDVVEVADELEVAAEELETVTIAD